jgi:hypothetical protein
LLPNGLGLPFFIRDQIENYSLKKMKQNYFLISPKVGNTMLGHAVLGASLIYYTQGMLQDIKA